MFRFTTPELVHYLLPQLTWRIQNSEKKIFLTFDDGPVPGPTEEVLQILKDQKVKATFFCVGDNIRKHPHIFKKVVDDGHQVGNHTFHHLKGWETKDNIYYQDVADCEKILIENGHQSSKLFRPPYGKITFRQMKQLKEYKIVMWDVLARDFEVGLAQDHILNKIKKHTRSGSIIVFHDSVKTLQVVKKILPSYIEYCKLTGFQFATL